jgi:hypothetical protein
MRKGSRLKRVQRKSMRVKIDEIRGELRSEGGII